MMAGKNNKIEDLIRDAFMMRFYPDALYEQGKEYDIDEFDEVSNLIKDASNLEEARNIIIDTAQKNPAFMMPFVRSYINQNRKEGENWNENAFDFETLNMRPIDVDNMIISEGKDGEEDLFTKAHRLANSLGYDIESKGLNSLIADYLGGRDNVQYGKKFFKNGITSDVRKKKANEETYLKFLLDNEYAPNIPEDKLIDELSSILSRVNEINYMKNRGAATKVADQIFKPRTSERESMGQEHRVSDGLFDLAGLVGAGKVGGLNIDTRLKLGAGAGLGALLDYAHGIADSLGTERTYIDTPDKKLTEKGDVIGALTDWKTPVTTAATGMAALFGGNRIAGGGRYIKNALEKVSNSNLGKKVKTKFNNAMDALFDKEKALGRKAAQDEHLEYLLKGKDSGITEFEDAMNVKRINEIADEVFATEAAADAARKIAESGATLLFENPPKGMKRTVAQTIPFFFDFTK